MATIHTGNNNSLYNDNIIFIQEQPNENSLAKELAHFGNLKTEFVIFGRLAADGLLREGRLEEFLQVCNQVLAIDPNNEEMNDLKSRVTKVLSQPNASQLVKEEYIKQANHSPIRRLRRSVSEIQRRRPLLENLYDDVAVEKNGVRNGGNADEHNNSNSDIHNNDVSHSSEASSPPPTTLKRSFSERVRNPKSTSNVLDKIKQFEQTAKQIERHSLPATSSPRLRERRASVKPSEETLIEDQVLKTSTSSSCQDQPSTPKSNKTLQRLNFNPGKIESKTDTIKQEPVSPTSAAFISHNYENNPSTSPRKTLQNKISEAVANFSHPSEKDVVIVPRQESVTRDSSTMAMKHTPQQTRIKSSDSITSSPDSNISNSATKEANLQNRDKFYDAQEYMSKNSKFVTLKSNSSSTPIVKVEWTEAGLSSLSSTILQELEKNLFNSDLNIRACLVSSEGVPLGLTVGFRIKQYEIQTLAAGMNDSSFVTGSKLTIAGITYSCLSGTKDIVRARVKDRGVNCTKLKSTKQYTIIIIYEHPIRPKQIAELVKSIDKFFQEDEAFPGLIDLQNKNKHRIH